MSGESIIQHGNHFWKCRSVTSLCQPRKEGFGGAPGPQRQASLQPRDPPVEQRLAQHGGVRAYMHTLSLPLTHPSAKGKGIDVSASTSSRARSYALSIHHAHKNTNIHIRAVKIGLPILLVDEATHLVNSELSRCT